VKGEKKGRGKGKGGGRVREGDSAEGKTEVCDRTFTAVSRRA